jgi:hypothetical protein
MNYTTTHTVIKNTDIEKYLTNEEILELNVIQSKIALGRLRDGRNPNNTYLVINTDEQCYNQVLVILDINEINKQF